MRLRTTICKKQIASELVSANSHGSGKAEKQLSGRNLFRYPCAGGGMWVCGKGPQTRPWLWCMARLQMKKSKVDISLIPAAGGVVGQAGERTGDPLDWTCTCWPSLTHIIGLCWQCGATNIYVTISQLIEALLFSTITLTTQTQILSASDRPSASVLENGQGGVGHLEKMLPPHTVNWYHYKNITFWILYRKIFHF